jgi:hypothetical protein
MSDRITQIIVDESNFASVEKYLEGKEEEFRSNAEKEFKEACGTEVEHIRTVHIMRDKSLVKGKVVVDVTATGLDGLEGQVEWTVDLTRYLPDLEKLTATPYGSRNRQND